MEAEFAYTRNPVAVATPAFGILTAAGIRCGSAGSWEGVAGGCGQMLALGLAAGFPPAPALA